jgi:hypothetical protein
MLVGQNPRSYEINRAMPNAAAAASPPINAVCNPLRSIERPVIRPADREPDIEGMKAYIHSLLSTYVHLGLDRKQSALYSSNILVA